MCPFILNIPVGIHDFYGHCDLSEVKRVKRGQTRSLTSVDIYFSFFAPTSLRQYNALILNLALQCHTYLANCGYLRSGYASGASEVNGLIWTDVNFWLLTGNRGGYRIQDFPQGWAPNDGLVIECYWTVHFEWWNSAPGVGARPSAHPLDPRLGNKWQHRSGTHRIAFYWGYGTPCSGLQIAAVACIKGVLSPKIKFDFLGHWSELRGQQLAEDLKFGYQRLRHVTR